MIYWISAGVLVTSWLVGTIIYGFATGRMWIDLNFTRTANSRNLDSMIRDCAALISAPREEP